jgi:hypothetical protein
MGEWKTYRNKADEDVRYTARLMADGETYQLRDGAAHLKVPKEFFESVYVSVSDDTGDSPEKNSGPKGQD